MSYPKKLIEVALPLESINREAAREKSIRHGHPSTLHLWWARRPLAACRAVIFAQMVDDPGSHPELFPTEEAQVVERERLFNLIRELVKWENVNDERVLEPARAEIRRWAPDGVPPPLLDPFAGGGSIPLEAQRLGLEAHASDLNPVAVLINKALIEIPPKFAGMAPVHPESRGEEIGNRGGEDDKLQTAHRMAKSDGGGTRGLSVDVEFAKGGNLRDALPDHTCGGLYPGEYRRGLGEGVGQGEGPVSGDSAGFTGGGRDTVDSVRVFGMVPGAGDPKVAGSMGRGGADTYDHASQSTIEVGDRKESVSSLIPTSSTLFPLPYRGAQGLAEDVRYYGKWMRDEAEQRIGHLYPQAQVIRDADGGYRHVAPTEIHNPQSKIENLTVIAWLWARTVACPNPACRAQMPLVRSFALSTKPGKQAWVEPVIDRGQTPPQVTFEVRTGAGKPREGTVNRKGATCICCNAPVPFDHVRAEGRAGRMAAELMAIVAEGHKGRAYLPPDNEHVRIAQSAQPTWRPNNTLPHNPRDFKTPNYGMTTFADLFTPRQLVALTTFSDLVSEARAGVQEDARTAGLPEEQASAYADAVATYLAFAVDQSGQSQSTICTWNSRILRCETLLQASNTYDVGLCRSNPFCESSGSFQTLFERMLKGFASIPANSHAKAQQNNATELRLSSRHLHFNRPTLL